MPEQQSILLKVKELTINCIIKLKKKLSKIVDKIDPEVIFRGIFKYIKLVNPQNNADLGIKASKHLLDELIRNSDSEYILSSYNQFFDESEVVIRKWIGIILQNIQEEDMTTNQNEGHQQIIMIINQVNKVQSVLSLQEYAIQIKNILDQYPSIDF